MMLKLHLKLFLHLHLEYQRLEIFGALISHGMTYLEDMKFNNVVHKTRSNLTDHA